MCVFAINDEADALVKPQRGIALEHTELDCSLRLTSLVLDLAQELASQTAALYFGSELQLDQIPDGPSWTSLSSPTGCPPSRISWAQS